MWYRIIPNDTLFFRDGRPFTMGAETWANPIFPPYPATLYGAIRSWLIFEKASLKEFYEGKLKEELGTKEEKGNLKITGPIIAINDTLYFPVPKDMLVSDKPELVSLILSEKPSVFVSDNRFDKVLINKTEGKAEEAKGYLDMHSLIDYLKASENILTYTETRKLFISEPKIGIKRNIKTLQTEAGYLYRIPMIRVLENTSLVVKIEGVSDIPEKGIIQLGGEAKTAKLLKADEDYFEELDRIDFDFQDNLFKLVLITPAIFKKGWIPAWINENTLEGEKDGVRIKLSACSIGKYILIGGWDMAKDEPKPMRKAVPAGSVYYFEILEGKDKVKEVFHLQNISDIYPEEGFGLGLIGEV
jgi:CRISPR-associated protein Cmr3